jgi:Pro-kumamolisin, activation domain
MLRHPLALVASLTLLLAAACDTEPEPAPASGSTGGHASASGAQATVVTTPPGFTRLSGALPPLARLGTDAGLVDPSTQLTGMSLTFHASASARAQGRAVLADLENPTSPRYHQWLKPAQVAPYLGASAAQVAR